MPCAAWAPDVFGWTLYAPLVDRLQQTGLKAFTRIDDSRNRETGGYGLGLAIVARVAELHGGNAEVDASQHLGGARFTIRWAVPG